MDIKKKVLFANIKSQKIYDYVFGKLILGFKPQIKHFDIKQQPLTKANLEIKDITKHKKHIYIVLQNKNQCLANKALAYSHYKKGQQERKQRISNAGNLVLVKNHTVDR